MDAARVRQLAAATLFVDVRTAYATAQRHFAVPLPETLEVAAQTLKAQGFEDNEIKDMLCEVAAARE